MCVQWKGPVTKTPSSHSARSGFLSSHLQSRQRWGGRKKNGSPRSQDRLLYRLVHKAQRIEMQGESMRRKRSGRKRAAASPRAEKRGSYCAVEMTPRWATEMVNGDAMPIFLSGDNLSVAG